MLLMWHSGNRKLLCALAPFYFLLCCATVYIQAHYLVDALAGVVSALLVYIPLFYFSRGMVKVEEKKRVSSKSKSLKYGK